MIEKPCPVASVTPVAPGAPVAPHAPAPRMLPAEGSVAPCNICGAANAVTENCEVPSNVRAFTDRRFRVWRCGGCGSIHATDEVDLAHFYARYPFLELPLDWRLRTLYAEQLRRLEAAGLRREHRVLDYGCGSGAFVRYLNDSGYAARGYDGYNERLRDPTALTERYDCVLAQDVLEHVAEPRLLLDQLHGLARPGGLVAIGTPDASAIDLARASDYRHALHAPYHRHILSVAALLAAGHERGWSVSQHYSTQYANTAVPFLNSPFYLFFMRALDDTLDCLFEPPRLGALLRRLPEALYWGLAGSYSAEATDIMVLFKTPKVARNIRP